MSLQKLFGSKLDGWTEGIVAAFYLHKVEPQTGMFEPAQDLLIREVWEQLRGLPEAWATELCLETLEQEGA